MDGKIYKITNRINGKVYVGQTTSSLEKRFYFHMSLTMSNHCLKVKRAVEKYGKENFSIALIDTALSIDDLNEKEIFWIKELNSIDDGYNIRPGGRVCSGYKLSEERKNGLRKSASERHDHFEKLGISHKKRMTGVKQAPEQIKKRRSGLLEAYRKKGKYSNETAYKKVSQYSLEGRLINIFDSMEAAKDSVGLKSATGITACCKLERRHSGNFQWRYTDDGIQSLDSVSPYNHRAVMGIDEDDMQWIFSNIKQASEFTSIKASLIRRVCNKQRCSTKNFKFEYI